MANLEPAPSKHAMWRAYTIAPAVTPIAFVALLSVVGIVLPLTVIAAGVLVCYLVAGLIGMPIAFSLHRQNALNGYTIHGAAFLWGVVCSIACAIVATYVVVAIGGTFHSVPMVVVCFCAFMVPPVVLSGTAFWLLLRYPQLNGLCTEESVYGRE